VLRREDISTRSSFVNDINLTSGGTLQRTLAEDLRIRREMKELTNQKL
jgi:hypothetical protein